jgi:hypothetical protein
MEEFKIFVLENEIIQITKKEISRNYRSSRLYNIYIDGKRYRHPVFKFRCELEFEDILNAKSIDLKEFKTKNFLII